MVEKEWGAFLDFLVQFKDHPSKSDLKKTGTNVHPSPEVKLGDRAVSTVSNFVTYSLFA